MALKDLFTIGYNNRPSLEGNIVSKPEIKLDSQQEEIVYSNENNIIVVAGAGSGKTRVLTERVKYLINSGVPAHNIVAITFTNMAAEEMKERLKSVPNIGDAFIGTIHSFANKVMQQSNEDYKIYNSDLEIEYFRYLITKYGKYLTFDRWAEYNELNEKAELGLIPESQLNSFLSYTEMVELKMLSRCEEAIQSELKEKGYTDYPESIQTKCKENNVITFDELIKKAEAYFKSLGAKVEHLLVDEFQDIGKLEFSFIEGLNSDHNFFVGDDWQSIYGFKGGNVNFFIQIVKNSDFKTYYLTNNYRNAPKILDMAKTIINQVDKKIDKNVTAFRSDVDGDVQVMSRGVIESFLSREFRDSTDYRDWFILTRTNKELFNIVSVLNNLGIPSVTFRREGLTLDKLRNNMNKNAIKVLTVHTSKGLESKNVILYGKFPIYSPPYLKDTDERKIMYVGCTRAENRLIIMN